MLEPLIASTPEAVPAVSDGNSRDHTASGERGGSSEAASQYAPDLRIAHSEASPWGTNFPPPATQAQELPMIEDTMIKVSVAIATASAGKGAPRKPNDANSLRINRDTHAN